MKEFEKGRVLYGSLRAGTKEIENIRCEVKLNRVDSSEMRADLYDTQGIVGSRFLIDFFGKEVSFVDSNDEELIQIDGFIASGESSGHSDKLGTLRIQGYREDFFLNHDPIVEATYRYYLTDIIMFRRKNPKQLDAMYGLLVGWDFWSEPQTPKWRKETYAFKTGIGELNFYPALLFADVDKKTTQARDQMMAQIVVTGANINVNQIRVEAQGVLETYLHAMSFLESRVVDWFCCEVDARSKNGRGMVSTTYKRIPRLEYNPDTLGHYIDRNCQAYYKVLPSIVDKYARLESGKKSELDKAIAQMLIGTEPRQSVEIELIYWHSCLDILIKLISSEKTAERKNLGFSKRLVLACEDMFIEWADLYPYITREKIFSDEKSDFKITSFRNNMIHEGKYPDAEEYGEIFCEIARARALTERMIMKTIGVDYKNTPIGKYRDYSR
jgi:hypothetical protein